MGGQSTITELTLFMTVILAVVVFVVPRKYILLPYAIGACFVPADQTLMVGELNFQVLRILVVVGMLRLVVRSEVITIRWNRIDRLLLVWFLVGTIVYVIQWRTFGAFITRTGRLVEWLCLYWVFRQTVRSWADLRFAYVALAVCAVGMLPFVAIERATGQNPFALLGRVATYTRLEQYRCQATFPHSIMMGLFWATLVPLFVGFARQQRQHRGLLWAAVAASTFMILSTASSTPILTLVAVAVLLMAFPLRSQTSLAAWGLVAMALVLHIVMKAPVWHLVARVGVVEGSTGWHRFYLIDEAIRHFPEWMLLGTRNTGAWGWGLGDVTNQYILEGVRGGLITLVLFCAILFVGARAVLRLSLQSQDRREAFVAWGAFVTMIAHGISFVGVSYFGQIDMIWYLLLAGMAVAYSQVYEAPRVAPRAIRVAQPQHAS